MNNIVLSLGIVKNNADPAQHGRLQIFIPSIDAKNFEVENLPWASYVSPFGGVTANFKVGREQDLIPGASAYGFWAIPKNSAQVICGFLDGEPNVRFWMGCFYNPELNRTLPQSVNPIKTEIDESGAYPQTEIPHYRKNLDEAKLAPENLAFKTRGGWERSVSHPSNKNINKPNDDGYAPKPLEPDKSDSQAVSLTTAGRHYIAMSDVDDHCRVRIKTTAGNQIIFDDTNERIYISTAKGRTWVEFDEGSGKVYVYAAGKINVHSENDINMYSDQNINIVAKKRVNIQSEDRGVKIQSKNNTEILSSGGDVKVTSAAAIHLKANGQGTAAAVGESSSCSPPPYSGTAIGLIKDWAEDAPSGTGSIMLDAKDSIQLRSNGSIKLTSGGSLSLKSMGSTVGLQGLEIGLSAPSITTSFSSFGAVAQDYSDNTVNPITSNNDAGGVDAASEASEVLGFQVKNDMIVPLHDEWIRDEDESSCKTPRNSKYVG